MSTAKKTTGKRPAKGLAVVVAEEAGESWPRLRKGAKSLLGDWEWPPGFEGGRRLLLACPEFKLFERWPPGGETEFEYAPEVENALYKSLFRNIDTEGVLSSVEERVEIAKALLSLLYSSQRDKPKPASTTGAFDLAPGCGAVGTRAVRTIGALLQKYVARASSNDAAKVAAKDAANVLTTCVRAVFVHEGLLLDLRSKTVLPIEVALIHHLRLHASIHHVRPSKLELKNWLKPIGFDFRGKDSTSKWRAAFDGAALSGLLD